MKNQILLTNRSGVVSLGCYDVHVAWAHHCTIDLSQSGVTTDET